MNSWFVINGNLPEIDYPGDTNCRYPEQLVELMLTRYSHENDWVLDPFCGFGTTLTVCSRLNRNAVGFEKDDALFRYTRPRVNLPSVLHHDAAENIASYSYPRFNLVLTSPPFRSFRDNSHIDHEDYYHDLISIFSALRPALASDAYIIVESVNLLTDAGYAVPRAFRTALALESIFHFEREHVCCNANEVEVTPGYQHSYLLVFRNGIDRLNA